MIIGDLFIPNNTIYSVVKKEYPHSNIVYYNWDLESEAELTKINIHVEKNGPNNLLKSEKIVELGNLHQIDLMIIHFYPISNEIINNIPSLKYIGILRAGTENIDQQSCEKNNIKIINTPGRNANAVAEFTLGMVLSEMRNIARAHKSLLQNNWTKDFPISLPRELRDCTIGIIGYGNIGRLVAKKFKLLGSHVIIHDPFLPNQVITSDGFECVSDEYILENSDVVSIHLRLSDKTYHYLSKKRLSKLKQNTYLINVSRAELVDELFLVELLKSNKIAGAALDVFSQEPLAEDHPICSVPNATLTSHLAGTTSSAFTNSVNLLINNIKETILEKH